MTLKLKAKHTVEEFKSTPGSVVHVDLRCALNDDPVRAVLHRSNRRICQINQGFRGKAAG